MIRSPFGGGSCADGKSCQTSSAGTTVAAQASATGRRQRGSRCECEERERQYRAERTTAVPEPIWASGNPPTSRAHAAMYAASQPFRNASATATDGSSGWISEPTSASPRSGPIASVTSTFASSE